jgi:hypothetical protein
MSDQIFEASVLPGTEPVSREEFNELIASVQQIADEWDAMKISKRGPDGPRGEPGKDSTVAGPKGPAGKDGRDAVLRIGNVVAGDAAEARLESTPQGQVLHLTLPRGLKGDAGRDSVVAGPKGEPGKDGVDGKDGRNGVDGKHGKDGRNGLDGKHGKDGRDGLDGKDGIGLKGDKGDRGDKGDGAEIDEEKLFESLINRIGPHMEVRHRQIWKGDIQAGIRGHLAESHQSDEA